MMEGLYGGRKKRYNAQVCFKKGGKTVRKTNDLGRDPVFRLVCRLAIPTMLAQLVSVLYSIVDRIYIGNIQGIGDPVSYTHLTLPTT